MTALLVLVPLFLLMALGYVLRLTGFLPGEVRLHVERLAYWICIPALLVSNLAEASFADIPVLPLVGALVAGISVAAAVVLFLAPRFSLAPGAAAAALGASLRPNIYVGAAGAVVLANDYGLTLAAIILLALTPLVEALCSAHAALASKGAIPVRSAVPVIAFNPVVLAAVVGVVLNKSGVFLPPWLYEALELAGNAALPLGLLALGAWLSFSGLAGHGRTMLLAALLKLLVLPGLVILACRLFEVPAVSTAVAALFTGASAAPAALRPTLPGEDEALRAAVSMQTVFSVGTLPLLLLVI